MAEPTFTCPRCGHVADEPNNTSQGYCPACQGWTGSAARSDRYRYTRPKPPSPETEKEWVERIRQGDKEAFASLFRTYYNRLCIYIEGHGQTPETAEDLVEDIFATLWANREREIAAIKPYLFQSARNRALKYIRDNRNGKINKTSNKARKRAGPGDGVRWRKPARPYRGDLLP